MENGQSQDFRFVIDGLTTLSVGAKYTYAELADDLNVSYKYRAIIRRFIMNEVDGDTTLESHLYYMGARDGSAEIYRQLKTKVVTTIPEHRTIRSGEDSVIYKEHILSIDELTSVTPETKKRMGIFITEIRISKLGLMGYAM